MGSGVRFVHEQWSLFYYDDISIPAILVLYLVWKLSFDEATATVLFHGSLTFIYFCCIFGAIVADSWWGKYKTIWVLSIVDALGSVLIAVAAIELLKLPAM
jgi:dipeptide/tripeptide permease